MQLLGRFVSHDNMSFKGDDGKTVEMRYVWVCADDQKAPTKVSIQQECWTAAESLTFGVLVDLTVDMRTNKGGASKLVCDRIAFPAPVAEKSPK